MKNLQKKFQWNRKTIERRIKDFKNRLKNATDEVEKTKIQEIITDFEELLRLFEPEPTTVIRVNEAVVSHLCFMKDCEEAGTLISSFVSGFAFVNKIKNPFQEYITYERAQILELLRMFYASLGDTFNDPFQKLYAKLETNHNFFGDKYPYSQAGFMYPIRHIEECYTGSLINGTIADFFTPVHEIGHGVEFLMRPDTFISQNNRCFIELVPLTLELMATAKFEELYDMSEIVKNYNIGMGKAYYEISCQANAEWNATLRAMPFVEQNGLEIINNVSQKMSMRYGKVRKLLEGLDFEKNISYSLAYAIAIEIYMVYKQSPKDALDILERIIQNNHRPTEDILTILKDGDCYPGTRCEKYSLLLK